MKSFPKINKAQREQNVIQREKATVDGIKQAYYGETSDNVRKIQRVLIALNYWTGKIGDTPTGYFGDKTKNSLISFQKNNMKLQDKDLYDKKGNYVGCDPRTAEKLNKIFRNLYCNNLPSDAINSIIKIESNTNIEKKPEDSKEAKGKGKISEDELRFKLKSLIKVDLNIVEENKNIGYYSTDDAIDIIIKYDDIITKVSKEFGVPKSMIQTVLFKEIRMKDARDDVADSFVMEYYRYDREVKRFVNLPLWKQLLVGSPRPQLPMREDSSTGLGQIFAKTAIEAYNAAIKRGDIKGQIISYDNIQERERVWNELQDDKKNIFYAALVLKHKAEIQGINLDDATDMQIQKTLARYNGTGDKAAEYGKETLQYNNLFEKYN